jgi:hypothetical protein
MLIYSSVIISPKFTNLLYIQDYIGNHKYLQNKLYEFKNNLRLGVIMFKVPGYQDLRVFIF